MTKKKTAEKPRKTAKPNKTNTTLPTLVPINNKLSKLKDEKNLIENRVIFGEKTCAHGKNTITNCYQLVTTLLATLIMY